MNHSNYLGNYVVLVDFGKSGYIGYVAEANDDQTVIRGVSAYDYFRLDKDRCDLLNTLIDEFISGSTCNDVRFQDILEVRQDILEAENEWKNKNYPLITFENKNVFILIKKNYK